MELKEVAVPYFSIGSLLAPVSWTMDMQSCHVPFSVLVRSHTGALFCDSTCWSSNTVRFERFGRSGNTLCVTEVFVFDRDTTRVPYRCYREDEIDVFDYMSTYRLEDEEFTLTRNFQTLLPRRSSVSPLKIWVVKVTEGDMSEIPELQAETTLLPGFMSKVAWLRSQNYEIFLHISLDAFDGIPESTTHAIERILQDMISKYRRPQVKVQNAPLPAFLTLNSTTFCEEVNIPSNSGVPMLSSYDRLAADKTLSCFFFASAIFTSLGKALLVMRWSGRCAARGERQPIIWNAGRLPHPHDSRDAYPQLHTLPHVYEGETNDRYQDAKTSAKGQPVSYGLGVDSTKLNNVGSPLSVVALLQRLVSHRLKLNTSGDFYMITHFQPFRFEAGVRCDSDVDSHTAVSSDGVMSLRAVCLTSLPLTTDVTSIYNYRSVEYAFEKHVERMIHEQRCSDQHGGDSNTRDDFDEIELIKIHSLKRFVPSDDFLHVVQERLRKESSWDTVNKECTSTDFEDTFLPHVPLRSTLYGLHRRSVLHKEENFQLHDGKHLFSQGMEQSEDGSQKQTEKQFLFVAQLIAPRVNSTHAMVLVAAVEPGTIIERDEVRVEMTSTSVEQLFNQTVLNRYEEAATLLSMTFFMEFPHSKRWKLSCDTGNMSGLFFRQGHLLLCIPSGYPHYYGTTVRPNAAKCFTSLGSLFVQTDYTLCCQKRQEDSCPYGKAQHNCLCAPSAFLGGESGVTISIDYSSGVRSTVAHTSSQPGVYSSRAFKSLSAVWTLLTDGRTSDEFIDFYISEFYYFAGVMNINNVDRRTAAVQHGETVLTVRKKLTRNQISLTRLANGDAGRETIAWLDVGPHHQLYVCARECGVGRMLLIQSSILLTEDLLHKHGGDEMSGKGVGECEEASLEAWVDGITARSVDT